MKSVCPMVCQKNENVLYTPSTTTASNPDKTLQTSSKPLVPLEGLIFSALKQRQAGWIQSMACFASLPFIYKSMAPLVGAYLLNIQIKGFPRNITKHTKRNMLRHSTNPCGKPSFSSSPLRGTVGVNTIKSFRSSERLPIKSPCIPVAFAFAQARANKCRCK